MVFTFFNHPIPFDSHDAFIPRRSSFSSRFVTPRGSQVARVSRAEVSFIEACNFQNRILYLINWGGAWMSLVSVVPRAITQKLVEKNNDSRIL